MTSTTGVGTYAGANTCSGAVDPNYDITYVAGDATITKAGLTITASTTSSVYGTTPTVTASFSPPPGAGTLTTPPTCSSTVTSTTGVGTYTRANTCSGAVDGDYAITYVSGDATVTRAPVTITASSTSTPYGTIPTVTASYSPSADAGLLTTPPTCSSTVTATTGVGTYTGANTCS
ncbi:MAG: MBG domain-containing protein, partial [Acidimicrobiales bacterium]